MNTDITISRFNRSKSARLVSAVAICVALATIGYSIVEVAAHFGQAPAEATAPPTRLGTTMSSEPRSAATDGVAATGELPQVVNSVDRIDGPRECAPANGIAEACTFN